MRRVNVSRVVVAVALWATLGCGASDTHWQPAARLVERTASFEPERPLPMTRLGGEARPVLRDFPELRLERRFAERKGGGGLAAVSFPLSDPHAQASHVVLSADTLPKAGQAWQATPPRLLEVTREQDRALARAELALAPDAPPAGVWARARVRVPVVGGRERIETAALAVPEDARLDLGFGLLPGTAGQGAVTFSVSACHEGGGEGDCTELFRETLEPAAGSDAWHDRSLSLDAVAGESVVFRFEALQAEGFMLPVFGDPTLRVPAPDEERAPSLILISLDTLRADRLPAYGYPLDTAPFLSQRIAAEGALFEQAVAPANMTGPSHMSVFTGLPPSVHGLRSNIRQSRLPDAISTLAEVLRDGGFTTGAVTENGALAYGQGIERGFASYRESSPAQAAGGRVEETLAAGREWLERQRGRRSFLFLHTYQPHTPYHPPDRYPRLGFAHEAEAERWQRQRLPESWHPEGYDREIRYTDDALRDFLEGLERDGLLADTLVVVFADHGEAFLEHDVLHHAGALHQEVLHVPLLFWGPGVAPGLRAAVPVGLLDLMPTLLELLGLAAPDGLLGESFAPLVQGQPHDPAWQERALYSESWSEERAELRDGRVQKRKVATPAYALRVGSLKLIREPTANGTRHRYYDLATDPGEQQELYAHDPRAASDLMELLDAYPEEMRARRERLVPDDSADEALPLDPDREEALRSLGYLE